MWILSKKMLEPLRPLRFSVCVMKALRKLIALVVFCAISTIFVSPANAAPRGTTPIPPAGPVIIKPAVSGL